MLIHGDHTALSTRQEHPGVNKVLRSELGQDFGNAPLVAALDSGAGGFPTVSDNQETEYHGGGIAFTSSHDTAITLHGVSVELYWILQCSFIMLENWSGARTALADSRFLWNAAAAASGRVTESITNDFLAWYSTYKEHFNMGTSRLYIDGGSITSNTAGSSGAGTGNGGGLAIYRLTTSGGEYPSTSVTTKEWLSKIEVSIAANVDLSGNGAYQDPAETASYALIFVSDATTDPATVAEDSALTLVGGTSVLQDPFTWSMT